MGSKEDDSVWLVGESVLPGDVLGVSHVDGPSDVVLGSRDDDSGWLVGKSILSGDVSGVSPVDGPSDVVLGSGDNGSGSVVVTSVLPGDDDPSGGSGVGSVAFTSDVVVTSRVVDVLLRCLHPNSTSQ